MTRKFLILFVMLTLSMSASAQTVATQSTPVDAGKAPTHRPLRLNSVPAEPPAPTEPETFSGYAQALPFKVVPRKDKLTFFPCSQCHKFIPPNPQPRKLEAAPHPAALNHGKGRLWCLNCHLVDDRDFLHTIRGEKVDFDQAYIVCGQCHSNRQKDWYLGGHGKRESNWKGERTIYSCTHCHDPHSPTLKPRKPNKVPPIRAGLQPMKHVDHEANTVWQRYAARKAESQ